MSEHSLSRIVTAYHNYLSAMPGMSRRPTFKDTLTFMAIRCFVRRCTYSRPDTETSVVAALNILKKVRPLRILDLLYWYRLSL